MEIVTRTQGHKDYLNDLAAGGVHLVTFAEDGISPFARALELAFNFDSDEVTKFCDYLFQADETGTLWPRAEVTAIPKRFRTDPLYDCRELRNCIRDCFVANRDYCQSRKLLFDFTGDIEKAVAFEDEIHDFAMGEFNAQPLEKVEIWFDQDPAGLF